MTEKWTICPHRAPYSDIGIRLLCDDGSVSNFVCELNGSGVQLGKEDDPWVASQRERALLIIAAPALLEALTEAETFLSHQFSVSEQREAGKRARAAIALAKGEQP